MYSSLPCLFSRLLPPFPSIPLPPSPFHPRPLRFFQPRRSPLRLSYSPSLPLPHSPRTFSLVHLARPRLRPPRFPRCGLRLPPPPLSPHSLLAVSGVRAETALPKSAHQRPHGHTHRCCALAPLDTVPLRPMEIAYPCTLQQTRTHSSKRPVTKK